jgi:Ca2+-binding RTX toxin-like protein
VLLVVGALSAGNIVPQTRAGLLARVATVRERAPIACVALLLTNVVTGSGTVTGGNANELILGSAAVDSMQGGNGNDCLLGGASGDNIRGDGGVDICLGGLGTDTFHPSCETQVQ